MNRSMLIALAILALCGPALAQSAAPTPDTDIAKKNGTLSDKLNATSGVIHPDPDVDPGMQKQAPATGTMPVIPPPGSPGGAQGVVPK